MSDLNARAAAALRRLHELGAIRSPWLAGMLDAHGIRYDGVDALGRPCRRYCYRDDFGQLCSVTAYSKPDAEPDTTDDLTVAAFMLLAREAWNNPQRFGANYHTDADPGDGSGWCVEVNDRQWFGHLADAWIAALEARVVALGG